MARSDIEALYLRYGSLVARRARWLLNDEEAARDVVHEVFLAALVDVAFRGHASPSTWLYAMTTHLCLNRLRDGRTRSRKLVEAEADAPGHGRPAQATPELSAQLRQALARLPEHLSSVAVYFYVDQMSYDEIADLTGVSRRTVANRLDEFRRASHELFGADPP